MTDHERIPVTPEAAAAAREAKREDETWSEYVLRCADADVPRKWTEPEIQAIAEDAARDILEHLHR